MNALDTGRVDKPPTSQDVFELNGTSGVPNAADWRERHHARAAWVFRLVQFGMLLSIAWKYRFFRAAAGLYVRIPIEHDFFPALLQSAWFAIGHFAAAAALFIAGTFVRQTTLRIGVAIAEVYCLTVLCLHQATYNDATFTTLWWTALWSVWLAFQMRSLSRRTLSDAALLSRMIVSMILLGGAIGKWTAEYWSGEVFYDIYFVDRDFWMFNLLRDTFQEADLRRIATVYSRVVVATETAAGFGLWLLPHRMAAGAGMLLLFCIAFFSNLLLFSVMACLIAMLATGFVVEQPSHAKR